MQSVGMALRVLRFAVRDIWQEFWTILIVHLLFLLANLLIIPGPPATLALFYYGNRVVRDEIVNERDFLHAIRQYWRPAWRWGLLNLGIIGLLTGDLYLVAGLIKSVNTLAFIQGLYSALLTGWLLLQLFTLPFLLEQEQPLVSQALRNAAVFVRRNLLFVLLLALLLIISLAVGILLFMLTFVLGGALVAFASNRAVLKDLSPEFSL